MANDYWHYVDPLIALAKETSNSILDIYYRSGQFEVTAKADATPLTQADLIAHEKLTAGLLSLTPDIPVLSEEQPDFSFAEREKWRCYWLVDPLDGTKEFIRHSGDFTINIALIVDHKPVLGLIYAPIFEQTFFALAGEGAYKQAAHSTREKIHVRGISDKIVIAVGYHYKIEKLKALLTGFGEYEVMTMGSALKFCAIAEGKADFYPRLGPTSEWDTAAGQIIVEEAGGSVVDFAFQPLRYNAKESLLNPHFLAMGDSKKLIDRIKKLTFSN